MKNSISRTEWFISSRLFLIILSCVLTVSILSPVKVLAVSSGLIKSDSASTVYYLSSDGYRYTFPSQEIFYSWYTDFKSVRVLSSSVVSSYTIAGYVNIKPSGSTATDPGAYVTKTITTTSTNITPKTTTTSAKSSTTTNSTTSTSTTLTMLTKQGRINIQKALNQILLPSPNLVTDGVVGTKTREAVKVFQSLMGLTVDGKIGQQTLNALNMAITNGTTLDASSVVASFTTSTTSSINTSTTSSTPTTTYTPTTTSSTYSSGSSSGGGGGSSSGSSSSDRTRPVVSSFSVPATVSSFIVPITSFVATDNVGVTGYMLTTNSSTPRSSSSSWTSTVPTSYTFSSIGSKNLYAWAKDAAKNVSRGVKSSFIIDTGSGTSNPDTTAPTVTAFTIPSTATSLTVSVSSFTATDNTAVTGYLLTETSSTPSAGSGSWTASAPTSYTFATTGTKTLYAWAKDAAGNVSTSLNDSVVITLPDTTAPTVTAFTIPSTATSLTIPITTFTASDNIGVTGYILTESSTTPSISDSGWTASAPTSYTFGSILGAYKYNFTQTLKKGMTSEEIKQLQKFLNSHGYIISNTGAGSIGNETNYFGELTKQAVIKFQQANKLLADGIVGQDTRAILNK